MTRRRYVCPRCNREAAAALAATSHHAQGEGQLDTFGNEAV